jgi:beta-glucuronidase
VADESERVAYLRQAMADFRQCADWLMGASIWTFNDYASVFPGSNPNGYRPWGLVTPERALRGMYRAWQEEFSPAILAVKRDPAGRLEVAVTARDDFPRQTLHHYRLRIGDEVFAIEALRPGETVTFTTARSTGGAAPKIVFEKPNGFEVVSLNAE